MRSGKISNLSLVFHLVVFLAGQAAVISSCQSKKPVPRQPAATASTNSPDSLPEDVARRIDELLGQGFDPCSKDALGKGKIASKLLGLPPGSGIDKDTPNCYSTVYYLLTGKRVLPFEAELHIADLLSAAGYKQITTIHPFTTQAGSIIGLKESYADTLQPGDAILFWGYDSGAHTYGIKHGVVYIGKVNDLHFVFQKSGLYCGPASRYEPVPLNGLLSPDINTPLNQAFYQEMRVFRK